MKHQTVVLSHQQMEQPVSVEGPCPYCTELSGPIPANQSTLGILSDLIMNYFSIHKMERAKSPKLCTGNTVSAHVNVTSWTQKFSQEAHCINSRNG